MTQPAPCVLRLALLVLVAAWAAAPAPLGARQAGGPAAVPSGPPVAPPAALQAAPAAARQDAPPATSPDASVPGLGDPARFAAFLEMLKGEAVTRGISEAVAARALDGLKPLPVVVARDRGQAEAVLSIDTYVRRRLTPATVRTAQRMFATHRDLLDKVGKAYGVQPRYLVAVWGLESNFGAFTGVRPTVQALATLAFEGRRGELFKNELFDALRIVERGHADLDAMKGSWAGAMGQPQFMPSSYLKYAEDFDGDGRRDIWGSRADVFASIANYLKAYGWDEEATWGRQVRLPGPVAAVMTRAGAARRGVPRGTRAVAAPAPGRVAGDGRARGRRRGTARGRSPSVAPRRG